MAESQEVAIKSYDLQKPEKVAEMAKVLKTHIVKHNLYTAIQGKNYVNVEGWQFAGGMLGIMPRVVEVKDLSTDSEIKWLAEVELVNLKNQEVVAKGFSICTDQEMKGGKKVRSDEYAVLSMAQTRAIGKAYRTCISWVMKVAGYEGTPSEDMGADTEGKKKNSGEEAVVDITPPEPTPEEMVVEAVGKIKRMRSLAMVEKVEESVKKSKTYNANHKKTIQKAIDEKKKELKK